MQLPFEAISGQNELHFTYLDTFGRPVVVYHKNNLVEQHIQEFEVGGLSVAKLPMETGGAMLINLY